MRTNLGTSRRDFLKFMGQGTALLALSGGGTSLLSACARTALKGNDGSRIPTLAPSAEDALRLSPGLRYELVAAMGDTLRDGLRFGCNNDYLAFFPLPGKTNEGLLCVNFEFPDELLVSGYSDRTVSKTKAQVEREMEATGVGIVHVRERSSGDWKIVPNSPHHRLITGQTKIPFASPRPIEGATHAIGTLANCAGGVTPWGTYLTCEENYDMFYGEMQRHGKRRVHVTKESFNWYHHFPRPPEHYGWVVEIHPFTGEAKKLTALGRFAHESATVITARDGRAVVYSGDDANNEHLYKFIAEKPGSLETGTLYVADTVSGRWLPLSWAKQKILREHFKDQTEVLVRAREAARLLGATPLDRPEDVEICPRTGAVYVALTNNLDRGNPYGSLLKLEEKNGDYLSLEFQSSTFLTGGQAAGFACPDNLAFDAKGNLWITSDISGSAMNQGVYKPFGNNGLFYVPMSGPEAGKVFLLATAPVEAEFTGPTFSPDGRTLFLSVQHPGERSESLDKLTSHWPGGGKTRPKSAVVAISGPLLATL